MHLKRERACEKQAFFIFLIKIWHFGKIFDNFAAVFKKTNKKEHY